MNYKILTACVLAGVALVVGILTIYWSGSGWGLVCSLDDSDVISCARNWVTSGAAILTGVAIVFAVAQVHQARRQSDAAVRANLVQLRTDLLEELRLMERVDTVRFELRTNPLGFDDVGSEAYNNRVYAWAEMLSPIFKEIVAGGPVGGLSGEAVESRKALSSAASSADLAVRTITLSCQTAAAMGAPYENTVTYASLEEDKQSLAEFSDQIETAYFHCSGQITAQLKQIADLITEIDQRMFREARAAARG